VISGRNVPALVQRPKILSNKTIVQIKFSADDSPSVRIYVGDAIEGHRVGTVAAILWEISFRVGLEALQVLLRKQIDTSRHSIESCTGPHLSSGARR
jgi:hypothetical protein